ncbi:MAG: TolC family protein [Acidobacteria bacterium]|nr:TolC family protein [Acidobacteriota bacterium]
MSLTLTRASASHRLVALALAASVVFPAAAEQIELSSQPDTDLPPTELRSDDAKVYLRLDEAIEIALRRNLALIAQRFDRAQAEKGVQQAAGIFDFNIAGDFFARDSTFPTASQLDGATVREDAEQNYAVTLSQLTPFGGTASLELSNGRFESNSTFLDLNPEYSSGSTLAFRQPLLRDFGADVTRRGLLLARTDRAISAETFEQQVIGTVQEVENAYWSLVQARKQLDVSTQSLQLAQELHERNRIRVDVGTLAPFELVQSEAGIARREGDIIRDKAAVGDAADALLQLLNVDAGSAWDLEVVPETEPDPDEKVDLSVQEAIDTALENRSELRRGKLEVDRLGIESHYFRNQKKPQVDLDLRYSSSGIGSSYGNANSDTLGLDFTGWRVGVSVAIPLQNRTARAQSAIADLALDQGNVRLTQTEQEVVTDVRSAVRQLEAAARQVDAARASRVAQEKSLEAERKRFENGMSTSFQVLQIQDDLSLAQSEEVSAVTNYRIRLADYYRAIGRLLDKEGIEIDKDTEG